MSGGRGRCPPTLDPMRLRRLVPAAALALTAGLALPACDVDPEVVCQATKPEASLVYRATWTNNRYECSARVRVGSGYLTAHWCWYERNNRAADGYRVISCGG